MILMITKYLENLHRDSPLSQGHPGTLFKCTHTHTHASMRATSEQCSYDAHKCMHSGTHRRRQAYTRAQSQRVSKNKGAYTAIRCVLACTNSSLVKNGPFAWFQLVCDRRTDGRTDGPTDGRTHPLIEMRERIYK